MTPQTKQIPLLQHWGFTRLIQISLTGCQFNSIAALGMFYTSLAIKKEHRMLVPTLGCGMHFELSPLIVWIARRIVNT